MYYETEFNIIKKRSEELEEKTSKGTETNSDYIQAHEDCQMLLSIILFMDHRAKQAKEIIESI